MATDKLWSSNPQVVRKYIDCNSVYQKLCEEIAYILEKKVREAQIEYSAVIWRVKTLESFCEKAARKDYKDPLKDIKDLAGVRLVYLYGSDKGIIEDLIESDFQVVEKVDKVIEVDPDHFGYGALHYLVKIGAHSVGARYDDLKDSICEIQIRTILQDAWAIVAHHLSYKQESDVPKELRRKLNALSGLFETADYQFDRLRKERIEYADVVHKEISSKSGKSLDREVDLDSLSEFLRWRFPKRSQMTRNDIADLLSDIQILGYSKLSQLDEITNRTIEAVEAVEKKYPPMEDETDKKTLYSSVGVLRTALRFVSDKFRVDQYYEKLQKEIEEFIHLVKEPDRA